MSDFRENVIAMSKARPNARASTIVALALAIESSTIPPLNDPDALARWAVCQPTVAAFIAEDKKIQVIKEVRALTGASLAQAKYALDVVLP